MEMEPKDKSKETNKPSELTVVDVKTGKKEQLDLRDSDVRDRILKSMQEQDGEYD